MKFKRRPTKQVRTSYNYKPNASLGQEEKVVYRRVIISFFMIILISVGLYFWGIEIVVGISTFLRQIFPQTQVITQEEPDTSKEPLFAPRLDPLPRSVNEGDIEVKGWAQEGVEVKIILNGDEKAKVLADKSGRFEYSPVTITEGPNEIYAISIENGQESDRSDVLEIALDTKKPDLEVAFDEENITDGNQLKITGTTEPTASIYVNDHRAILDGEGKFEYMYGLSEGSNLITIKATDEAGNTTIQEKTIEHQPPADKDSSE